MRAVIQRVSQASVSVEEKIISEIGAGLLIFLGVEDLDSKEDAYWLAKKVANLRIFSDSSSKMNNSILDINGDVIVVSQFTLFAKTKKGNRPSFVDAANSELAIFLYKQFKSDLSKILFKDVKSGTFGEKMKVSLINDGPVTIIIDTKQKH